MTQVINANPSFPIGFQPLAVTRADCDACGNAERVGFSFEFAYQPIADVQTHQVFAHEALVRGPQGEGAASVLAQVNELNRYRFDQACRVKAIELATMPGCRLSINFCPTRCTAQRPAYGPPWRPPWSSGFRTTASCLK